MKEKEIQKWRANLLVYPGVKRVPFFNSFSSGRPTCLLDPFLTGQWCIKLKRVRLARFYISKLFYMVWTKIFR